MADFEHITNEPLTIDVEAFDATPAPRRERANLATLEGVRKEMRRVYGMVDAGTLPSAEGAKRVWMLSSIQKCIESTQLETRVTELTLAVEQYTLKRHRR